MVAPPNASKMHCAGWNIQLAWTWSGSRSMRRRQGGTGVARLVTFTYWPLNNFSIPLCHVDLLARRPRFRCAPGRCRRACGDQILPDKDVRCPRRRRLDGSPVLCSYRPLASFEYASCPSGGFHRADLASRPGTEDPQLSDVLKCRSYGLRPEVVGRGEPRYRAASFMTA